MCLFAFSSFCFFLVVTGAGLIFQDTNGNWFESKYGTKLQYIYIRRRIHFLWLRIIPSKHHEGYVQARPTNNRFKLLIAHADPHFTNFELIFWHDTPSIHIYFYFGGKLHIFWNIEIYGSNVASFQSLDDEIAPKLEPGKGANMVQ